MLKRFFNRRKNIAENRQAMEQYHKQLMTKITQLESRINNIERRVFLKESK